MDKGTWPNLVLMFFEQVERYGDRPFLWIKRRRARKTRHR